MKKLILGAALFLSLSSYAEPVSKKVIASFNQFFPAAENVKWHTAPTFYEASFMRNNIRHMVYYDLDGNMYRLIKFYDESKLDPFLAQKIRRKYHDKKIMGVTEMQEDDNVVYQVVLKDPKHLYIVDSDRYGNLTLKNKFINP